MPGTADGLDRMAKASHHDDEDRLWLAETFIDEEGVIHSTQTLGESNSGSARSRRVVCREVGTS